MSHIQHQIEDRVLTLRFNRPDKKNALTQSMYTAMAEVLRDAQRDPQVRVVLLAGQPDCFTAGNDLMDFMNSPPGDSNSPVAQYMRALAGLEKPVIAAPAGIAVGIGVTLLLHCDLVYCGERTRMSMPFVSLGICPEFASSYLLPRLMGHARACELLLLGEPFSAETALEYGIVNALLPNEQVEAHARAKALQIAALAPGAVRTSKMLLKKWSSARVDEAITAEAGHFMPMLQGEEAREAIGAFLQKRKPDFSRFS
jgi:enoyl-CoA hydratase/carnithine racemase